MFNTRGGDRVDTDLNPYDVARNLGIPLYRSIDVPIDASGSWIEVDSNGVVWHMTSMREVGGRPPIKRRIDEASPNIILTPVEHNDNKLESIEESYLKMPVMDSPIDISGSLNPQIAPESNLNDLADYTRIFRPETLSSRIRILPAFPPTDAVYRHYISTERCRGIECPMCKALEEASEEKASEETSEREEDMSTRAYSKIVEEMGGDPSRFITEKECLKQLKSLSDREALCGAYWMFKQIFKLEDGHPILTELSVAPDKIAMERILRDHGL
jgi:hypothetical protein